MTVTFTLLLLSQELTAEEAFRKIEETIVKAKSLRLKVSFAGSHSAEGGPPATYKGSAILLMSKGKGVNRELRITDRQLKDAQTLVSDGLFMRFALGTGKVIKSPAPDRLEEDLLEALTRAGVTYPALIATGTGVGNKDAKEFPIQSFSFGPVDGDLRCLRCKMKLPRLGMSIGSEVWYDPKAWKPTKRKLVITNQVSTEEVTETYEEFTLNVDIPATAFEVD